MPAPQLFPSHQHKPPESLANRHVPPFAGTAHRMSLYIAIAASVGAAAGVFLDAELLWPARWVLGAGVFIAFVLSARGYVGYAVRSLLVAGCAACAILGAEARYGALHPPIRQLLEDQFGGFAIDTIGIDRHDTPFEVEGQLLADAAITDSGANLRIRLHHIRLDSCPQLVDGAVSITVAGSLIDDAAGQWRAGRIRSEEHTSELQSLAYLVCRLLLEKKKTNIRHHTPARTTTTTSP